MAEERRCNTCGKDMPFVVKVLPEKSIHYAECRCIDCGNHLGFVKKPQNENKRGRSSKYKPADLGKNYCQMCLRHEARLGNRETLEIHHIQEIQQGGKDLPENVWVLCTPCHRYVHYQRRYLNLHLVGRYSFEDLKADMKAYGVPQSVQEIMKRIYKKQEVANAGICNKIR
jgi:5-methylcytosine-specific restriction endonuclease McrA